MNLSLNDQGYIGQVCQTGAPALPTANLIFQMDASTNDFIWKDDAMTIKCADGEPCFRAEDANGSGEDFGNGTATDRPTWRANSINGLGVLEFRQAASQGTYLISSASVWDFSDATWFAVIRFVSSPVRPSDYQSIVAHRESNKLEWQLVQPSDATHGRKLAAVQQAIVELGKSNSKATYDTAYVLMVQYSDTSGDWLHERGGVADGSGNTLVSFGTPWFLHMGNHQNSGVLAQWLHADVGEVLLYNSVISADDVDAATGYLQSKWSL